MSSFVDRQRADPLDQYKAHFYIDDDMIKNAYKLEDDEWDRLSPAEKSQAESQYRDYVDSVLRQQRDANQVGFLRPHGIHHQSLGLGGSPTTIWWLPYVNINGDWTSGMASFAAARGIDNDVNIFTDIQNEQHGQHVLPSYINNLRLFMINSTSYFSKAELLEKRYFTNIFDVDTVIEGNYESSTWQSGQPPNPSEGTRTEICTNTQMVPVIDVTHYIRDWINQYFPN